VRAALEEAGIEIERAELEQRPTVRIEIGEEDAKRLFRLIESLEDNDDVGAVHSNFDVSDEVLERVAGRTPRAGEARSALRGRRGRPGDRLRASSR